MTVTNVTRIAQTSTNETTLVAITDPTEQAIYLAGPSMWLNNNPGTMEGIINAIPFAWKDRIAGTRFSPRIAGTNPISAALSGISYLKMGYGGTLAQKNLALAQATVHAGGSGYVTGDTLTDAAGSVFTVSALSGAVTNIAIKTAATYTSYPSDPVPQASTSGSGTGCTFHLDFAAPNGCLAAPSSSTIIPATGPMTFISVFRAPVPGGAAGATPGGMLLTNSLNQSSVVDTVNNRLTGLQLGFGSASLGKLRFMVQGDGHYLSQTDAQDLRDGNYHVAMADWIPSTGVVTLWLDGQQIATTTISTSIGLNTTKGAQVPSVGAAGLIGATPVIGFAGDIGDQMIFQSALSTNTSLRQLVINYLMTRYGIAGTSA